MAKRPPDLGLFDHVDQNRRKSVFLILGNVVFLGIVGAVLGAGAGTTPWVGIAIAVIVGLVTAAVAWGQGGSIMMAVSGAREIGKADDPELVNVVEELSIASGLPRPRIFLMETDAMNAFATGMNPDNAAVAVTRRTQHLFVVNPFRIHQNANSPFATHPPINERIRRLRSLAGGVREL